MGIIAKLISSILNKAKISYKAQITPDAYHIQLKGVTIQQADFIPGNFLRVFVGKNKDLAFKDNIRSYSVWKLDKIEETLDLVVCVHSNGPGSAWAMNCAVGDEVAFGWHRSSLAVDNAANNHLFIGDSSALGHLYEMNRSLSNGSRVQSIIYSPHKENLFEDIDNTQPFEFYDFAGNAGDHILKKIPDLIRDFSPNSMVYVAGDSRVCIQVHNYFRKELKWDARRIKAKPFWNPLKKGLE